MWGGIMGRVLNVMLAIAVMLGIVGVVNVVHAQAPLVKWTTIPSINTMKKNFRDKAFQIIEVVLPPAIFMLILRIFVKSQLLRRLLLGFSAVLLLVAALVAVSYWIVENI